MSGYSKMLYPQRRILHYWRMLLMDVTIRQLEAKDYDAFKRLFTEAYTEYLEFLKHERPQHDLNQERRDVTVPRFTFYLDAGSSFVAEADGEVVGYVASQPVTFMHGADWVLWIEYIVVHEKVRRHGIGLALLRTLIEYAKREGIDRIYTTINPNNEASIQLHIHAHFAVQDWKIASFNVS
jgi:L-amino acid N-acyltransferase YncA